MCTQVHFVLPTVADLPAVAALVERHKVGHGLAVPGDEAPLVEAGEHAYLVTPWKMCHCGWEPLHFAPVIRDALEAQATQWLGVLVAEQGSNTTVTASR